MMKLPAVGRVGIGFIEVDFNEFALVILGAGYPIGKGGEYDCVWIRVERFYELQFHPRCSLFPTVRLRYVSLPWV